ncbi:hypothetical protein ACEPAH_3128 [Sanghuangporus vaninii]
MAAQDTHDDVDVDAKLDRYKESNKPSKSSSSSKSKDVSHVPCKFFKVGSCTAGQSCPFSHQVQQPGQQKDVCAWFVKGNCKFGHKCALAHILPGQSPAMDRRNKKAAQLAAAAATGGNGGTGGAGAVAHKDRDRERDSRNRKAVSSSSSNSGQTAGRGGPSSRSNTLLSGSTAPTRVLSAGARPPLPISISKAAPAPAETAPALHDADFTSRDTLPKSDDGLQGPNQNGTNDAQQQQAYQQTHEVDASKENADNHNNNSTNGIGVISSPSKPVNAPLFPVSTPPRPHRFAGRHGSSPSIDFGPVGSPPRASPMNTSSNPIRINGFSPGTSPRDSVHVTQPLAAAATVADSTFSHSGAPTANLFMGPSSPRGTGSGTGGGNGGLLAASLSLGATSSQTPPQMHTQPFSVGSLPVLSRPIAESASYSEALDDEDMEDFVPSSLNDLLTPEEQSRRMSRTSSSHAGAAAGAGMSGVGGGIPANATVQRSGVAKEDSRHRHSRSVPSASLLSQNLRSIWSDTSGELGQEGNPGFGGLSPPTGALGASPSFVSSPGLHAFDKDSPSPSMLNPSNASAAFLGLHQYMGQGPSRVPGGISAVRAVSQGNMHHHAGAISTANAGLNALPSASSSFDNRAHIHGHPLSSSPSHTTFASRVPAFDAFSSSPSKYMLPPHTGRPVPSAAPSAFGSAAGTSGGAGLPEQPLSPASRALQAHVPGQSLPQGLAAGFSRIHLQPTSNAAFSPGSASGSTSGSAFGNGIDGAGAEWLSTTPTNQNQNYTQTLAGVANSGANGAYGASDYQPTSGVPSGEQPDVGGLTSMFSHLSYSSVAAGGIRGHGHSPAGAMPTGMSRRSSARNGKGWGPSSGAGAGTSAPHPLSSPLSGPVLTNDDDELFPMDEEK